MLHFAQHATSDMKKCLQTRRLAAQEDRRTNARVAQATLSMLPPSIRTLSGGDQPGAPPPVSVHSKRRYFTFTPMQTLFPATHVLHRLCERTQRKDVLAQPTPCVTAISGAVTCPTRAATGARGRAHTACRWEKFGCAGRMVQIAGQIAGRAWVKGELTRYVRLCSKESDFAAIRTVFATRLRARGYPGRWLRDVFEEIGYEAARPTALMPTVDNTVDCQEVHVLKLTHNPVWDDVDLSPFWHELADAWNEFGVGYPELRFMASFKKPVALGDRLNIHNRNTIEDYHKGLVAQV
ncbi:hypothetical protein B0H12DRAFT_1233982 [Mycena haematopus]|nr:hypothetical protein B0H12DRAFT_1233982 [Mycena haematopus]